MIVKREIKAIRIISNLREKKILFLPGNKSLGKHKVIQNDQKSHSKCVNKNT